MSTPRTYFVVPEKMSTEPGPGKSPVVFLNEHLRSHSYYRDHEADLCRAAWMVNTSPTRPPYPDFLEGWLECAKSRDVTLQEPGYVKPVPEFPGAFEKSIQAMHDRDVEAKRVDNLLGLLQSLVTNANPALFSPGQLALAQKELGIGDPNLV